MNKRICKKRKAMRLANLLNDIQIIPNGGAVIFSMQFVDKPIGVVEEYMKEFREVIDYLNANNVAGVFIPSECIDAKDYPDKWQAIRALQSIIKRMQESTSDDTESEPPEEHILTYQEFLEERKASQNELRRNPYED